MWQANEARVATIPTGNVHTQVRIVSYYFAVHTQTPIPRHSRDDIDHQLFQCMCGSGGDHKVTTTVTTVYMSAQLEEHIMTCKINKSYCINPRALNAIKL